MKTCAIDGCNAKHEALGLCRTHYRASRPRRADPKVTLTCDGCGIAVLKEKRAARYLTVQCGSPLCRHWLIWGAWSTPLPTNHPAMPVAEKPATEPAPKPEHPAFIGCTCEECGRSFVTLNHGSRTNYCSTSCARRTGKRARRAREHNAPGEYRYTEVIRIYLKQGKVCAYCMQPVEGLPDPEHVMPLSRGGRNDATNLVAACRPCNTDKGDLTLTEWATDRARRNLPVLRTTLDHTAEAFKHLTPQAPTCPAWRDRTAA